MRAHGLDVGTWFLGGVVAGLVLLSGAAMADDTQGAKPKRAVAVRSSRVTTLLAALEKADTAEQAATLLRNAKLNDAELAELEREVGKPGWTAKLETFKRTIPAPAARPATPRVLAGKSGEQVIAQKRVMLERDLGSRVAASNRAVQNRLTALAKVSGSVRVTQPAPVGAQRTTLSAPAMTARARSPLAGDPGSAARIDRVEPRTVVVGQTTVITGVRFGNTAGRVAIRTDEDLFYCEVLSWRDQRITVRIPREVRPWSSMAEVPPDVWVEESSGRFGGSGHRFVGPANLVVDLWVKLHGSELGPWLEIEVSPDIALLTPEITAVLPSELLPGGDVVVEGRNFGDQSDPHSQRYFLTLGFPGHEIRIDAFEWHDTYIVARVHEGASGVPSMQAGALTVRNRLGLEGSKRGLSFTPALDFHEVAGPTVRAICEPRNIPLLCLVGETNRSAWTQWELENGWTVEDSWLDVDDHGANAGGYWDNQPARDASRVRFRVVAWADAYSMVEVKSRVLLKGPRGTSHQ